MLFLIKFLLEQKALADRFPVLWSAIGHKFATLTLVAYDQHGRFTRCQFVAVKQADNKPSGPSNVATAAECMYSDTVCLFVTKEMNDWWLGEKEAIWNFVTRLIQSSAHCDTIRIQTSGREPVPKERRRYGRML